MLRQLRYIHHYSLKSVFNFSHPADDSSIPATRSASFVLRLRCFSVHSSYMVDRLNRRVCEEKPDSIRLSRISRP